METETFFERMERLNWTGRGLEVGAETDKGVILKIIEDVHPLFITASGSYMATELTIIK